MRIFSCSTQRFVPSAFESLAMLSPLSIGFSAVIQNRSVENGIPVTRENWGWVIRRFSISRRSQLPKWNVLFFMTTLIWDTA